MIIVLKGADFSANNIGQIDIPVDWQDETLAILAKQTRYTTSDAQAIALNQFIYTLKEEGIYSKIGLFMPVFMGNSLNECAYDAISDTYYPWTNAGSFDADAQTITGGGSLTTCYVTIPSFNVGGNFHCHSITQGQHFWGMNQNSNNLLIGNIERKGWMVNLKTFNYNKNYYYDNDRTNDMLKVASILTDGDISTDGSYTYNSSGKHLFQMGETWDTENKTLSSWDNPTRVTIGASSQNGTYSVKGDFHIIGNNQVLTENEVSTLYNAALVLKNALESA